MKTEPVSISAAKRSASAGSFVQALAPRPNGVSLAVAMASPIEGTRKSVATGPKSSCSAAGEPAGTSVSSVGS